MKMILFFGFISYCIDTRLISSFFLLLALKTHCLSFIGANKNSSMSLDEVLTSNTFWSPDKSNNELATNHPSPHA